MLGSSASQPAAGDASSGYLVTAAGTQVLLDCGSGILGNLLQHTRLSQISAIVVSHMHPDHYIDLVAMRYGLRYGEGGARPIDVYLPPGGAGKLQRISEAISDTQPFFRGALNLHEYAPGEPIMVGSVTVRPTEVVHGIRSFGMLVDDGRGRLLYSSDTVVCPELAAAAEGVDTLLAENTLGGGAPDQHEPKTHMSAVEAGLVAHEAGARRLVLTHFWHTADRPRAQREAQSVFGGEVVIARPHVSVTIGE